MYTKKDFELYTIDSISDDHITSARINYYYYKRIFDFVCAGILLIVLSPLFLLLTILILLDSPGPIFFRQKRVGSRWDIKNGRPDWQESEFTCFKFRTMVANADPAVHQAYIKAFINNNQNQMSEIQGGDIQVKKLVTDQRITRIGKFLRKSSIDEFPQLMNVFIGDMSLVGPRPCIPYEMEEYKSWHYQRFQAQQGITGLWQVTARSSSDFDEMIRLDIEYIENQSLWTDLKILFKTPLAVISTQGAE